MQKESTPDSDVNNLRKKLLALAGGLWPMILIFLVVTNINLSDLLSLLFPPQRTSTKFFAENIEQSKNDLEALRLRIEKIEHKGVDTNSLELTGSMYQNFDRVFKRLDLLESGLQSQPERFLSVPLLRKDLEAATLRLTEYQIATNATIDRQQTVFMWISGALATFIISAFVYLLSRIDTFKRR